jgi:hypothetical protein
MNWYLLAETNEIFISKDHPEGTVGELVWTIGPCTTGTLKELVALFKAQGKTSSQILDLINEYKINYKMPEAIAAPKRELIKKLEPTEGEKQRDAIIKDIEQNLEFDESGFKGRVIGAILGLDFSQIDIYFERRKASGIDDMDIQDVDTFIFLYNPLFKGIYIDLKVFAFNDDLPF